MALAKKLPPKVAPKKPAPLKRSTLEIFDIPVDDLVGHEDNPNEQDEATFDQLVEGIRADGFDEPIQVVPIEGGTHAGKWQIFSGHHRAKAAKVLGLKVIPAVVKKGWNEDKVKIELVRRNRLRGNLNSEKFTKLYNELKTRGWDESMLKLQMGFTKEDAFKKVYKSIEKAMTPSQKKKLEESKESIKSVDGLSSVLNDIFKNHGSDLDHGFVVFNFGGKEIHYIETDTSLNKQVKALEEECRNKGITLADAFKHLLNRPNLSGVKKSGTVQAPAKVKPNAKTSSAAA
jgi:hypothetical protein